jgi:hypothetical protein
LGEEEVSLVHRKASTAEAAATWTPWTVGVNVIMRTAAAGKEVERKKLLSPVQQLKRLPSRPPLLGQGEAAGQLPDQLELVVHHRAQSAKGVGGDTHTHTHTQHLKTGIEMANEGTIEKAVGDAFSDPTSRKSVDMGQLLKSGSQLVDSVSRQLASDATPPPERDTPPSHQPAVQHVVQVMDEEIAALQAKVSQLENTGGERERQSEKKSSASRTTQASTRLPASKAKAQGQRQGELEMRQERGPKEQSVAAVAHLKNCHGLTLRECEALRQGGVRVAARRQGGVRGVGGRTIKTGIFDALKKAGVVESSWGPLEENAKTRRIVKAAAEAKAAAAAQETAEREAKADVLAAEKAAAKKMSLDR